LQAFPSSFVREARAARARAEDEPSVIQRWISHRTLP
jgi:hypothetical protein